MRLAGFRSSMSGEALLAGTPFVASVAAFIGSGGGSFIVALFFSAERAGSKRAAVFFRITVGGVAGTAPEGPVFESGHQSDRIAMTIMK